MATFSKQDLNDLADAISSALARNMSGGMGRGHNRTSSYSNRGNRSSNTQSEMEDLMNFVKNNGIGSQFIAQIEKMKTKTKELKDVYDALEKTTRTRSQNERALNKVLVDRLGAEGNVLKTLKEMREMVDSTRVSMKEYSKSIKDQKDLTDKLNALKKREADLASQYEDLKKKHAKGQGEAGNNLRKNQKEIKDVEDALKKLYTSTSEELLKNIKDFNDVRKILREDEIEFLKNGEAILGDQVKYHKILEKINIAADTFEDDLKTVGTTLGHNAQKMSQAFDNFKSGMKQAGKDLLKAFPVAFQDMMAQSKYAVGQSDYSHNVQRGLSEAERDQLIGENRLGIRLAGNGNEQQGYANTKTIQEAAHNYGVYGADALKLGLQYQSTMINSGMGGNVKDVADQMNVMKSFAKDIGITDDQMKQYYDSLNETTAMQQLRAKYSDQSAEKQRKSINEEIANRLKLNQQLGISLQMQENFNQENINKQYGGIASMIMNRVQGSMLLHGYTELTGKTATAQQANLFERERQRGMQSLTPDEQKELIQFREQMAKDINTKLAKDNQTGSQSAVYRDQSIIQALQGTHVNLQQEVTPYLKAGAVAESIGNTKVTKDESYANAQKQMLDKVNNSFTVFNKNLVDAAETLHGIGKHPVGSAAETAGKTIWNYAEGYLGGKATEFIGKKIGGKILGRVLGKVGSRAAASVATDAAGATATEGLAAGATATEGGSSLLSNPLGWAALLGIVGGGGIGLYKQHKKHNAQDAKLLNMASAGNYNAAVLLAGRQLNGEGSSKDIAAKAAEIILKGKHQNVDPNSDEYKKVYQSSLDAYNNWGMGSNPLSTKSTKAALSTKMTKSTKVAVDNAVNNVLDNTNEKTPNGPNKKDAVSELETVIGILSQQLEIMKDVKNKTDTQSDSKSISDYFTQHIHKTNKGIGS